MGVAAQKAGRTGWTKGKARPRDASGERPAVVRDSAMFDAPRADVRSLRESWGLTQPEFARLTAFSVRKLAALEAGTQEETPATAARLTEIRRLFAGLAGIMRKESVGAWLTKPNEALGALKPLEVVERGEVDRLWRLIHAVESGEPT